MCFNKPNIGQPVAAPIIASGTHNAEASRAADIESSLRRRRAGAAANVLTGPLGLPSTPQLGKPA